MPFKIHPELAKLRVAAKAPREGYFSVLDELMQTMPDRPHTIDEFRQYLKANRMLQREDMKFPLKQEEIDYALTPSLKHIKESLGIRGTDKISPREVLDRVRGDRPSFEHRNVTNGYGDFDSYATIGPDRVGYYGLATESPSFGEHSTHFTPQTLSFSRGTLHNVAPGLSDEAGNLTKGGGVLRMIDEIQNDRANTARKPDWDEDGATGRVPAPAGTPAVGWRTPEEELRLGEMRRAAGNDPFEQRRLRIEEPLARKVPDAPFKTPQDYGRLEIKNQLLHTLGNEFEDIDNQGGGGADYLGITPAAGPESWFPNTGSKKTSYDKIYPGELKKIAEQYGAKFEPVPVNVRSFDPLNLDALRGTDITDYLNTTDWNRGEPLESHTELIDQLSHLYKTDPNYDARNAHAGHRDVLDDTYAALDEVRQMEADLQPENSGDRVSHDELTQARADLDNRIQELYDEVLQQSRKLGADDTKRMVPAMHLTPEVKERIARIGLPLFSAAGAAALSPELLKNADTSGEEDMPQQYGGGGPVSRSVGSLSRIREAMERSKPKGDEQAWLAGLAAQKASNSEPRLAVGREVGAGAGDYGKYMERHAGRPPEAPNKPAPGDPVDEGTLAAFRRYLGLYAAGGGVADPFADAIEGEYEDGDEYLGEDDDFEYYACGGPAAYGLGGSIKKGLKKVGKVVGKVAGVAAPIVGMINPAIGAGLMAGSALLGKATKGKAKQDPAAAAQAAAMGPARIAEVPNMLALQQQAQQPAAGAGPTQLSMLQQANAMQPPMQPGGMPMQPRAVPGANANGLLAQIQQQRMMQPQLQQPVM